jgi:hypothetical protein
MYIYTDALPLALRTLNTARPLLINSLITEIAESTASG